VILVKYINLSTLRLKCSDITTIISGKDGKIYLLKRKSSEAVLLDSFYLFSLLDGGDMKPLKSLSTFKEIFIKKQRSIMV